MIDLGDGVAAVDTTRHLVASAPVYDPALEEAPTYAEYSQYYAYYNLPAFWAPGYVHPPFLRPPPAEVERGKGGAPDHTGDVDLTNDAGRRENRRQT